MADKPATLHQAMALAFGEIESAAKSNVNPAFKSKYADLASVDRAVRPALAKHGLWYQQVTHDAENAVCVETIIWHSSGESLSCGSLTVPVVKRDAQGFGSALTYCRRYSLMTAFGVPAEDDDGNAAAAAKPQNGATNGHPITDAQRDLIQTLAPVAGKSLQSICEAYKVDSLKGLTEAQAAKLILRLQAEASVKEPANV